MAGSLMGIALSVVAGGVSHLGLEKPLSRWLLSFNQQVAEKGAASDSMAKSAT